MRRAVLALTEDKDVSVRRQVLYTLGALTTTEVEEARMRLLRRDIEAPFVVDAFMSGLAGREWQTLDTLVRSPLWASDRPEHRALVKALATAISNEGRAERVAAVRRLSAESAGRPAWQREAVLEGVQASSRARQPATPRRHPATLPLPRSSSRDVPRMPCARPVIRPTAADCRRLAPPLAGSPRVTGPPDGLIDIVLRGRDEDPAFPSMPPLAALPDDQLAAILTYVRQAWGNAAPAISAEAVRARRAGTGGAARCRAGRPRQPVCGTREPDVRPGSSPSLRSVGVGLQVDAHRVGRSFQR